MTKKKTKTIVVKIVRPRVPSKRARTVRVRRAPPFPAREPVQAYSVIRVAILLLKYGSCVFIGDRNARSSRTDRLLPRRHDHARPRPALQSSISCARVTRLPVDSFYAFTVLLIFTIANRYKFFVS